MQEETLRNAFTFAPVLKHRTQDANRRITAVSLDTAAGRIFLGLASGHVEEHQIVVKQAHVDAILHGHNSGAASNTTAASTRLVAEKRVSKDGIKALACLPTAARIAILCEDGTAAVAAYDTWVVTGLQGVRTATAMAADSGPAVAAAAAAAAAATAAQSRNPDDSISASSGTARSATAKPAPSAPVVVDAPPRPVRLAVAVKSLSSAAKLLVYSISPAVGFAAGQPATQLLAQVPLQEPVQQMTWVGAGLFVQHGTSYSLLQPGGRVTQIAPHGCSRPRMASAPWPTPLAGGGEATAAGGIITGGSAADRAAKAAATAVSARGALLFQDSLVVLTDGNGTAVVGSEPIAVSELPLALCSSGPFLVMVSDAEGVLVYDRATSRLVQRIFWSHDDPWIAAAGAIPVAEDASGGGAVAIATSTAVMLLMPVAADMQARELLKRKRFDPALALIRSCRRAGEEWADIALAQAGLLMLQELRCEDALAALEEAGTRTFQPCQLLPLFPRLARRWLAALPHRPYWGLHGSLLSLERICEDFLELRNSTSSSPRPSPSPQGSTAGAPPSPPPPAPPAGASPEISANLHHHHRHHHHQHHHQHHHHVPGRPPSGLGTAETAVAAAAGAGRPGWPAERPSSVNSGAAGGGGGELAALMADAQRHIVSFLLRTRRSPGVTCLDGIDTLLAHLLVETGDTDGLENFLGAGELLAQAAAAPAAPGPGPAEGTASATATAVVVAAAAGSAAAAGAGRSSGVCAAFGGASGPNPAAQVSPRDAALVAALEGAGRYHALAVLRATRGQVSQALELWQRLALEEVAEAPSAHGAVAAAAAVGECPAGARVRNALPSGPAVGTASVGEPSLLNMADTLPGEASSAESGAADASTLAAAAAAASTSHTYSSYWAAAAAAVAAASAATLMARAARTPPLLCLSKLPWLLDVAPDWALHVMRSRPLPVADVMSLLQGRTDGVRWQYLHHLVYSSAEPTAAHSASTRPDEAGAAAGRATAVDGEGGQLVAPVSPSVTSQEAADATVPAAAATAAEAPAAVPWHLDPSLHTELALELLECITLLHSRSQALLEGVGRSQASTHQPPQAPTGQGSGAPTGQGSGATAPAASAGAGAAAIPLFETETTSAGSAFSTASAATLSAGVGVAALPCNDVPPESVTSVPVPVAPPEFAALLELAPRLPPMPFLARAGSVTVADAAAAAAAGAGRPCSPPPMPVTNPPRTATPLSGHLSGQQHPHLHQHHHGHDQSHGHQQHPPAQWVATPRAARTFSGPPADGGSGGMVARASGGVRHAAASAAPGAVTAGGGGGAAAGASASAATTVPAPCPSELAWLGTLGVMMPAAVAKQMRAAVRAAMAAAGQDPDAPAGADGDGAAAVAGGCSGGSSLSLLRALSRCGDGGGIGSVEGLRAVLQHHLYFSPLYDAGIVLQALSGSPSVSGLLLREAALLHCRLSDHTSALAVIALALGDVDGAISYCRARCGQEGWLALLDLLLRPGEGRQPDYVAACRVLAAEGAALAPLQVLEALSDDMPLHLAHGTLSRMVGSVLHHKRQGQVMRALHRAQNLALRAELAQLQSCRVLVTEETLCRGCQRPLSTKVFYRYPSGVVLCARCVRPDSEAHNAQPGGEERQGRAGPPAGW